MARRRPVIPSATVTTAAVIPTAAAKIIVKITPPPAIAMPSPVFHVYFHFPGPGTITPQTP